ncbi:MAG: hypothetical protein ACYCOU_12960 [Sulfobacillus sp.]
MSLEFDLASVRVTSFGVGHSVADPDTFVYVPVDVKIQEALRDMASATWTQMQELTETPDKYDPSEKYAAEEYVYLPLADVLATSLRGLYQRANIQFDSSALREPEEIVCYFTRLIDSRGRTLIGLRRATQFKGVLNKRLMEILNDSLRMVASHTLKLDLDFDLLIDADTIHVLRPTGLQFLGGLQQAVLSAASGNVTTIANDIKFVNFSTVATYATVHPRAAMYLASILRRGESKNIDRAELEALLVSTKVRFKKVAGKIVVDQDQVLGFLEVLDRRRYQIRLVANSPEPFLAASRQRVT